MIPGYSKNESLKEGRHGHLLRCIRAKDNIPVLIRATHGQSHDPLLAEQLESGFVTLRNLHIPGVMKVHELIFGSDSTSAATS